MRGEGADAAAMLGGDLSMETWLSGSTITIDVGGFAPILQQNVGTAEIFPAEVFTVDVARLADGLGAPDVAAAITGQATPDPVEMAEVLGAALADAEAADTDRYAGTLTLAEYSAAFGQDIDALLGSHGGVADVGNVDAARLQEAFDAITIDETPFAMAEVADTRSWVPAELAARLVEAAR